MVLDRVRTIPDTVDEFIGYRIGFDLWALDGPAFDELKAFHANGKAVVRNVWLPAEYAHVIVPATRDLAAEPRDARLDRRLSSRTARRAGAAAGGTETTT